MADSAKPLEILEHMSPLYVEGTETFQTPP